MTDPGFAGEFDLALNAFQEQLRRRLESIRQEGLLRELRRVDSPQGTRLRIGGEELLNFSSNDYLGLASHPALQEAAIRAIEQFGAGSGASRLVCGSLAPHHRLEEALAEYKRTEGALTFSSGYTTAIGTVGALVGKGDIILLDKLAHSCLVEAARLSGATLRVFHHNSLEDLEKLLRWAEQRRAETRPHDNLPAVLIITESVFSMDGDGAPLREIAALKNRFGASLMVDEAHATGLYGLQGSGRAELEGVADQIEIQMGTLGKAVGAAGGYIAGSRELIDLLVNRARAFIFSTAPPPATVAAAAAGLQVIRSEEGAQLRARLWKNFEQLRSGLREWDEAPMMAPEFRSAIVPIRIGLETEALRAAASLREKKLFVPAIRFPSVARGQARLRLTVTAAHREEDIRQLLSALRQIDLRPIPAPASHA